MMKKFGSAFRVLTLFSVFLVRTAFAQYGWNPQTSSTTQGLNGVSFFNMNVGMIVGDSGTVLRTENGGADWLALQTAGTSAALRAVALTTPNKVMAVGDSGIILDSQNGGASWQRQSSGVKATLRGLVFNNQNLGLAVGDSGRILKTMNGGNEWTIAPSGVSERLYGVSLMSANDGVAVGDQGVILRTLDGGTTWQSRASGTTATLRGVSFADNQNGTAVGDSGIILRTVDGGFTWARQTSGTTNPLRATSTISRKIGTVLGSNGTILRTTNGMKWGQQAASRFVSDLNALVFLNASLGYAVGSNGLIIQTSNGGVDLMQWLGTGNSNWSNPLNWSRNGGAGGVPMASDSVVIPSGVSNLPTKNDTSGPVNSVHILPGASLQIDAGGSISTTDELEVHSGGQLVLQTNAANRIEGDIVLNGTLSVGAGFAPRISCGGSWIQSPASTFGAASSTVEFFGFGTVGGTFYDLVFDSLSAMTSSGNITVLNRCVVSGADTLRGRDTLFIQRADSTGLTGKGILVGGTIRRGVQQSTFARHRFESDNTFIRFPASGTLPSLATMTVYPDTNPRLFGNRWVRAGGRVDPATHTIRIDSVQPNSRWVIVIPRVTSSPMAESLFVRRVYDVSTLPQTSTRVTLSFRYEPSELPPGAIEDSLQLYRLDTVTSVSDDANGETAYEFALRQNYPNPFNPATQIGFTVQGPGVVALRVYDVLGREVATLVNEEKPAGRYTVEWNAERFASGTYFYRLEAGGFSATRKLLLLR